MSSKNKLILGAILGLLAGIILYFVLTYEEAYFDDVELSEELIVRNSSDIAYLDTIVSVGLEELNLNPTVVQLKSMNSTTRPPITDGMKTEAYIIGNENHQYLIMVDNMSRSKAIKIMAHELIHLQQYESGELAMDIENNTITWKGKTYTKDQLPPYSQREWEYEAEKKAVELRKRIKGVLYKD